MSQSAKQVVTINNDDLNVRYFHIDDQSLCNSGIQIERAISDDVVGVYSQWTATGDLDPKAQLVSNVKFIAEDTHSSDGSDAAKWAGGPELDLSDIVNTVFKDVVADPNTNTVVESTKTERTDYNVVSEFRRTWDFNAGKVTLYQEEGIAGDAPYITQDLGTYDIPNNDYARDVKAKLAP